MNDLDMSFLVDISEMMTVPIPCKHRMAKEKCSPWWNEFIILGNENLSKTRWWNHLL